MAVTEALLVEEEPEEEVKARHHHVPYHPVVRPEERGGMLGDLAPTAFLELDSRSARWRRWFLTYLATVSVLSAGGWVFLILA